MGKKFKKLRWYKVLEEIPLFGEVFEKVFKVSGSKFAGKLACCCLPFAIILLVPVALIALVLISAAVGYFQNGFNLDSLLAQAEYWLTALNDLAGRVINLVYLLGG